jgi:putative aminopeptidase FrvX
MFNNIKKLCELNGISGRETAVANEIINQIKDIATDIQVDNLGNVIAFKKGKKTPKNRIMLNAHTDEVGMIVTGVTDDGMLRFATVGGVNSKVIIGRSVRVSEKEIVGVIGTKAVHMQTADEKKTAVPEDKLFIDIGAKDKEDALKHVALGDSVTFVGNYVEFGDGFIKAKAIDDRAGCAILIEIMKQELEYDTYFAFVVQEEVGLRGSRVAAHTIEPDIAIVVESTASGDVSGVSGADRVTVMGEGAVVGFMDRSTIYDKGLYDLAFKLAKEKGIACQTKTKIAGGNDAGAIHVSRGGVRTIAVSIPSRYIHSPANVVKKDDVIATYQLTLALTNAVGEI